MDSTLANIILYVFVFLIIACFFFGVRKIYKSITSKGESCGCGGKCDCHKD